MLRANQAAEEGDDDLHVILGCLVGVLHFLDADIIIQGCGLTRPLGVLAAALRDLGQGARPALFFDRPRRGPGRPKDVSFEAARGAIAAAVSVLIEAGEARDTAGQFVADQLRKGKVKRPGGKTILARQVLRWRDEIGSTASDLAGRTFRDARAKYATIPSELMADERKRRDVVRGALIAVKSMGF